MADPRCERFLAYFDRAVLSLYRVAPDRFELYEDEMGGYVKLRSAHYDSLPRESRWYQIRFGFRVLVSGSICVAGFVPDLAELPNSEKIKWFSHELQRPEFSNADEAFERWTARYLGGSWDVEDGPLPRTKYLLKLLRALTHQILGKPLFRHEWNPLIGYPVAENTEAYANAHLELYRVLIDGLDNEVLETIAERLKKRLSDPCKTMNSLKELLPETAVRNVYQPLKKCYDERQEKHGVPSQGPSSFAAFDTFHRDLVEIVTALDGLKTWLEGVLLADSKACLQREGVMRELFPKLIGPPRPQFKLEESQKAAGKTIRSVEFGEEKEHPELHQSEGIVINFTDGSSMAIRVGSNAMNLCSDFKGLKPSDVHTDLMIFWAPPIEEEQAGKRKREREQTKTS